jgi:hypothetical protein
LATVRDLARLLAEQGKTDWVPVNVADLEAFLNALPNPAGRKSTLVGLRQFFRWARHRRPLLVDPTTGLNARDPRGFHGTSLDLPHQKAPFRRWTTDADPHPHEALIGLLALLHGASSHEARMLTLDDIHPDQQSVQPDNGRCRPRSTRRPGRRCNAACATARA